jgi:hypothetical protein
MALASGPLESARPLPSSVYSRCEKTPPSREAELTTRLLKFREHRARLLAASRTQTDPPDGDEIMRRRLIARAEGQIARIEAALRPKRAYFTGPAVF